MFVFIKILNFIFFVVFNVKSRNDLDALNAMRISVSFIKGIHHFLFQGRVGLKDGCNSVHENNVLYFFRKRHIKKK